MTIPSTVEKIGYEAFFSSFVSAITLPSNMKRIDKYAFSGCTNLENIVLPTELEEIGFESFACCGKLTSLHIPANVKTIGDMAFLGCNGLSVITVDENNAKFDSRDNCNAIVERSDNRLYHGCQTTVIPSTVNAISDGAFRGCNTLTSIVIPGNVKEIGSGAFSDCGNLSEITLCEGLEAIRKGSFWYTGLSNITIPTTVKEIEALAFWMEGLTAITSLIEDPFEVDQIYDFSSRQPILYVPVGCKDKYKATAGWKNFKDIREFDVAGIDSASSVNENLLKQKREMYDLQGRRVNSVAPRRGVYVKNGKKIIDN